MARVIGEVHFTCGCGFKTQVSPTKTFFQALEEAIDHSQKKNHTLTINGLVKKEANVK